MRLLLSNDDGCTAPGLMALREHLSARYALDVVAPDRNRSGASNSLSLHDPLRIHSHGEGVTCVDGTPTDCLHLALAGLLSQMPDMVVSGINAGANLGDDTLYSGTVAAAMEGRALGFPAIAVSNVAASPQHYDASARVVGLLIERLRQAPLPADTILNVNVPDVAFEDLRGFEVTRLGSRHRAEAVLREKDPRGRDIYWINPAGPAADAGPGTDFHAIEQGKVSITPLVIDLTRHQSLDALRAWVQDIK